MPDAVDTSGWWSSILRRARERDVERVLLYDRSRRSVLAAWFAARGQGTVTPLLADYLKALLGAVLGFWLLAWPLEAWLAWDRVAVYAALGLVFSLQVTHHAYRLAKDPAYTVRRCNCGGSRQDDTKAVLTSRAGTIAGLPVSWLGAAVYAALLITASSGQVGAERALAVTGVLASAYLAFVMVARIGALCTTCINVAALNVLIASRVLG